MPYCDICGKETKILYRVVIEGVVYNVCSECAKMGKVLGKVSYEKPKQKRMGEMLSRSTYDEMEEGLLLPEYGDIIKKAREAKGLSRKDLAAAIGIKESLLAKIEHEELIPEDTVRRKIERFLGIKLVYGKEE